MSKNNPGWHTGTVGHRVVFPNGQWGPFGGPGMPATRQIANIPREGMNTLWAVFAADDTFDVVISLVGRGGVEMTALTISSIVDAVTGLNVVQIEGLHLTCVTWNLLLNNAGLNMSQADYFMEMKP